MSLEDINNPDSSVVVAEDSDLAYKHSIMEEVVVAEEEAAEDVVIEGAAVAVAKTKTMATQHLADSAQESNNVVEVVVEEVGKAEGEEEAAPGASLKLQLNNLNLRSSLVQTPNLNPI